MMLYQSGGEFWSLTGNLNYVMVWSLVLFTAQYAPCTEPISVK